MHTGSNMVISDLLIERKKQKKKQNTSGCSGTERRNGLSYRLAVTVTMTVLNSSRID